MLKSCQSMVNKWIHHTNGYIILLMNGYTMNWLLVICIDLNILVLLIELQITVESIYV